MFSGIIKDFLEESKGFDWPSSKILKILGDCKSVPGGLSLSETNLLFVGRPNQPFLLLLHLVLLLPICFTIVFPYPLSIFGNRHHGPRRPFFFLPLSLPAECFLLLIILPLLLGRGIMGLSKEWGSVTIFACDKLGRIRHAPSLGNSRCR